jgi:ubiquinone/menaquinone biosynthesis C-methylase UbiE
MNNTEQSLYGDLCSRYYDATEKYATKNEVDFYASFMKSGHRTLEAMSGSGRLQIPLLQRGYHVDGVDSSTSMLQRCQERCREFNLAPRLYEQRIEHMALDYTHYKTVIIAVGSFQLIADKTAALHALQQLRAHMADDGTLLLDIFVPDPATHNKQSTAFAYLDNNKKIRFSTRHLFHKETQLIDALCAYELIVNGTVQQREEELMQFTWYTDDQITQLLRDAGFTVVAFHEQQFRLTQTSRIVEAKATST